VVHFVVLCGLLFVEQDILIRVRGCEGKEGGRALKTVIQGNIEMKRSECWVSEEMDGNVESY
jgi:hypothetical protein